MFCLSVVARVAGCLAACWRSLNVAPPVFGAETLTPAEVFKHAVPGVVAIDCLGINNARISTASGFIISDNGRIATNLHVVESCSSLRHGLTNGDVYDSTWVVATDKRRDLAVITESKPLRCRCYRWPNPTTWK